MTERKWTLPLGWRLASLTGVAVLNPKGWKTTPKDDETISFVPMASVEAGTGRFDPTTTRPWREVKRGYTTFQEGDILFAKVTPCMENGKCALAVGLAGGRGAGSTEFFVLRPTDISRKYLLHFLLSESFRREARRAMQGVAGLLRVRKEFMESASLPLPPPDEQERIVAEIEKQFTRLDAGVEALTRLQVHLRRYRAAVLKAACEGRLLSRSDTDASRRHVAQGTSEQGTARGLPPGWRLVPMASLVEGGMKSSIFAGPFGTIFKAKDFRASGVPIIFLRHVAPGRYLTGKPGFMDASVWERLFRDYSVFGGELLVTKLGEPPGACAIYPEHIGPAMVTPDVIAMRVDRSLADPRYLMHYLNSDNARRVAFGLAFGTTRLRLTLPLFRSLAVPLPPLSEQRSIVAEVDRLLSVADQQEGVVELAMRRAARLREAILDAAFNARLLPVAAPPSQELHPVVVSGV